MVGEGCREEEAEETVQRGNGDSCSMTHLERNCRHLRQRSHVPSSPPFWVIQQ